jgi:hypothetical protein
MQNQQRADDRVGALDGSGSSIEVGILVGYRH